MGLPVWRYELDGYAIEKRVLMPHGHNTVHLTYRLLKGQGPVRLTLRPSVQFRGYEGAVDQSPVQTYSLTAVRRRYELSGGAEFPCLRMAMHGPACGAHARREGRVLGAVRSRTASRLRRRSARCGARATSAPISTRSQSVTLVASTESWEVIEALSPEAAAAAPRPSAAATCSRIATPVKGDTLRPRAGAGRRSVHHHAGRPRGRGGPGARRGRGRADGDCRLPLVHGLGPRHDDQPRGADALDPAAPRSGLHPPHLRALRARRADPEHVPGRRA